MHTETHHTEQQNGNLKTFIEGSVQQSTQTTLAIFGIWEDI